MNKLKEKGDEVSANKYGGFSKNGYQDNIHKLGYDLVHIFELFKRN